MALPLGLTAPPCVQSDPIAVHFSSAIADGAPQRYAELTKKVTHVIINALLLRAKSACNTCTQIVIHWTWTMRCMMRRSVFETLSGVKFAYVTRQHGVMYEYVHEYKAARVQRPWQVERLGGAVVGEGVSFTHFVALPPDRSDRNSGFRKTIASLLALAAGPTLSDPSSAMSDRRRTHIPTSIFTCGRGTCCSTASAASVTSVPCRVADCGSAPDPVCQPWAGRPIVVPEWVEACAAVGGWVDTRQYLLKDKAAEAKDGFSLASVYEAAQQRRLLDGIDVFLTPGVLSRPQSVSTVLPPNVLIWHLWLMTATRRC